MNKLTIGFTTCYIRDYPFDHICDIPDEVALVWISKYVDVKTFTNKQFVIVGGDHGKYVAINYSDGGYSIYLQR